MRSFSRCISRLFFGLSCCFVAMMQVGCQSLNIDVPGPMVLAPELPGKKGALQFAIGVDDATRYTYTTDASYRPPNLSQPVTERSSYLVGRGGYSVFDWLEVSLSILPGSIRSLFLGGIGLTAHAQILGVGGGAGPKLSIYGGSMQSSSSSSGEQNGLLGPGGYNWRSEIRARTTTVGSSLGYRFEEQGLLVFVAHSYADQAVNGSVDHDLSSNGTSPAMTYALQEIKGTTRTSAIGISVGTKVIFTADIRAISRSWPSFGGANSRGGGEVTETAYGLGLILR